MAAVHEEYASALKSLHELRTALARVRLRCPEDVQEVITLVQEGLHAVEVEFHRLRPQAAASGPIYARVEKMLSSASLPKDEKKDPG